MEEPAREIVVRRAGGTQPRSLTLDDVVDAALDVTRRHGLGGLTVRAVADVLMVTGPALYYHVPGGKQSLIDLVVERVVAINQVGPEARPDETWIDRLERQVLTVAVVEHDYPGVLPYLMSAGRNQLAYISSSEQALRVLLDDAGFPPVDAARALAAITALVIGWSQYQAPSPVAARRSGFRDLERAAASIADDDPASVLRVGLRALLEGLDLTRGDQRRARQPNGW